MSSWRSKFRRTKTPDQGETKTSTNFARNSEEADQNQKKRISRFLRRSKQDEDERPRPRSFFLERNTSDFNGVQNLSPRNLNDPPSVQEILDRNRRERSMAKSPRPWRKFLTGDRSPNAGKRGDQSSSGNGDYSYKSRYRDENRNYENDKYESSSQISNESDRYERRGYSEEGGSRKNGLEGARNGRTSSRDGPLKSDSEKSMKNERSRSASPYDNVEESSRKRRERRSKSLYVGSRTGDSAKDSETSSLADITPRSKRRERMRRSDSQDTVNSERSQRSQTRIEKETFVLRRAKASYPTDDGDEKWKSRSRNEEERMIRNGTYQDEREAPIQNEIYNQESRDRKSPRFSRKLSDGKYSGYTTDSPMRENDKINRSYERGTYSRRSSENILGAALNYIERKPTHDYLSTATNKMIEEYNESSRERRGRYRALRSDKSLDNVSIPESENENSQRRKFSYTSATSSYKQSTESTTYRSSAAKRDSHAKPRPKSLYDYNETPSFSESLAKFKDDDSASYGDRYRPRNDYSSKEEPQSSWRRPKTLFMVEDEKKESAYRGNWSISVPKRPDHLRDFSKPSENTVSYSWRNNKREKEEKVELNREDKYGELEKCNKDESTEKDNKAGRFSYRRRQSVPAAKSPEELKVPAFEFTVSQPKEEPLKKEEMEKDDDAKIERLGEDTIVRRRRREHAPPARPSSVYYTKTEDKIRDTKIIENEEKKVYCNYDDDDDDGKEDDDTERKLRRRPNVNLDSEDIKTGLRKKSAVERRLRSKYTRERPKSVNLADVFGTTEKIDHLPKVTVHDTLTDTVNEVKREFERLLRRTEDWKLRTESLNSKATVLSTSYRSLNKAITGIRDESDDMYAIIDNIGERLNVNDSIGYPDTEDEWRRALEAGKLLEKALRMLDYQKRHPKPDFEYSDSESEPSTPGKPFYDMPRGIPWFSRFSTRESSSSRLSSIGDQYATRKANDYIDGSSRSYISYRPSLDVMGSLSTSARLTSSYVADTYTRRSRYQDTLLDYKGSSSALNVTSSNGRLIPETAV